MAAKKKDPLYVWSDTPTAENISDAYVTPGQALEDAFNECSLGDTVTVFELAPAGAYLLGARWDKLA